MRYKEFCSTIQPYLKFYFRKGLTETGPSTEHFHVNKLNKKEKWQKQLFLGAMTSNIINRKVS